MKKHFRQIAALTLVLLFGLVSFAGSLAAQEVDKGKIPDEQLAKTYKKLPWGVAIWDNAEAIASISAKESALWVDTRPATFFEKGTIRDSVNLIYHMKGAAENTLSNEALTEAITAAGLSKDTAKIVFFCQGPKCHRSYNAAFAAVTDWGFSPDNVIWYRDGYPNLFDHLKEDAQLKRKAKMFISDAGLKQL